MFTLITVFSNRRKTLSMRLEADGRITVHAPTGTSMDTIHKFVQSHEKWIEKNMPRVQSRAQKYESADVQSLTQEAKQYIPPRVEYLAVRMGLYPQGVKITSAKTRFGSCSAKNSLCFSCYLMLYPKEAIDYVIVHELAHIKEKNHSDRFYKVIEDFMPDYKSRIRLLKK